MANHVSRSVPNNHFIFPDTWLFISTRERKITVSVNNWDYSSHRFTDSLQEAEHRSTRQFPAATTLPRWYRIIRRHRCPVGLAGYRFFKCDQRQLIKAGCVDWPLDRFARVPSIEGLALSFQLSRLLCPGGSTRRSIVPQLFKRHTRHNCLPREK